MITHIRENLRYTQLVFEPLPPHQRSYTSIIFPPRSYFRLPKVQEWTEINPPLFASKPDLLRVLAAAYSNRLDNIDVYIGGMLESRDGPGELFTAIIKEQFARIRDADRFWFENTESG
uniref:Uncharacterized protein n=1 Tax=Timema cristinae TaxID=61476 RepID=A0A7R9CNC4_TIMCR|nr:unnamed protein product [Timema cristinae]